MPAEPRKPLLTPEQGAELTAALKQLLEPIKEAQRRREREKAAEVNREHPDLPPAA